MVPLEPADDETDDYEASGPEGVLTSAGFDAEQAAAIVEAMRMCCDEMAESKPEEPPKGGKGGSGKGVDIALVFGKPKAKR
jgi:hypothetical protein